MPDAGPVKPSSALVAVIVIRTGCFALVRRPKIRFPDLDREFGLLPDEPGAESEISRAERETYCACSAPNPYVSRYARDIS